MLHMYGMDVQYDNENLERLVFDPKFGGRLPPEVVTRYRKVVAFIRRATDERDLRAWPALHFEKLKVRMAGQYSMRLNRQWRLLADIEGTAGSKKVVIRKIENHYSD